jgi:hypothetical protein
MKKHLATAALAAVALICVSAGGARAQSDSTTRRQQRQIDSLAALVAQTIARLDSASSAAAQAAPVRAAGAYMNIGFDGIMSGGWSSNPNVRALQTGDHDPRVRGFTIPQGEMSLDAVVDPYFKGFANIVHKLDENGETGVELEEMYFLTSSLPKNFQLKGGQFLTDFGRQNATHPHAWAFVDQPLVLGRMFGGEGLRGQGLRLSWLLPTSFYTEAMITAINPTGETAFSFLSASSEIHGGLPTARLINDAGDLLYVPRVTTSFDLTETQTVVAGVSGAFGPNNAGDNTRTSIYGADLYWKWKSATAGAGFPFVSFQAEAMKRRYDADSRLQAADLTTVLPAERLNDQGGYAELLWGVKPRVVLGFRAEDVSGNTTSVLTDGRVDRRRFSPNFTWYPTEFSRFRLQYNRDSNKVFGSDNSLWAQFEFIMGAHAAHKF